MHPNASLQEAPSGSRFHIGLFGKTNSGKSTFLNGFCGQDISIVSNQPGTTTDPVYKSMELAPIGPVTWMDTAGSGDETALSQMRMEKTLLAVEKADAALFFLTPEDSLSLCLKDRVLCALQKRHCPLLFLVNKADLDPDAAQALCQEIQARLKLPALAVSMQQPQELPRIKEALLRLVPETARERSITGSLVEEGDLVLLVMPQDIQAPKGRLILPQVQTLRELLDRKCLVFSVTADRLPAALSSLQTVPKLIITDSQVFSQVHAQKPSKTLLTSFSVLYAAYKGDIDYYLKGAEALLQLPETAHILIAECCTHAPLPEDIGREKLPRLLRKKLGSGLQIQVVSGTDFPKDLRSFDLILQCGGCMFNRTYVLSRIQAARSQGIPMTNYGIAIAALQGILKDVALP